MTYFAYKASLGSLPYRANENPVFDLGQRTKLAIIGDWGTGDDVAINLLQQVAKLGPEILIHLGDVYYAGTHNEEQVNFLDICRKILGNNVLVFSLCGNHDMYSGGQGYYWLVGQIGQQASYFCLQSPNWQFLAMDTGHNDNNLITVATNMTKFCDSNCVPKVLGLDFHAGKELACQATDILALLEGRVAASQCATSVPLLRSTKQGFIQLI